MRIEKIIQIKSVGRFLDAKCSGDANEGKPRDVVQRIRPVLAGRNR